ncbi:hypothetical protein [Marinilabilia rubra]|uniref:DUF4397 domain-containing protein n=1 Tax=Marinilabilia rubra TaxID=2162893 RepID=A0A2U2B3N0_9BACT|nr:hypothetical protein [Marinilabilia rubra]PWD97654.1 hypothetical protein DDZ16_19665 [Marinilabilia rubra]
MRKLFFLVAIAAFLGACEKDDPPAEFPADPSDNAGNLMIVNSSNRQLVLYDGDTPIRFVPNSETDYLVNIPAEGEIAVDLKLYDWEDVRGNINNPDPTQIYKRWSVPISGSTDRINRVTWHVSNDPDNKEMANIYFNYYGGSEEYVDVYLNGREGAKIMTLKPGDQQMQIGLDFGNYTLHYHYWNSDQTTADGRNYLSWIDTQMIGEDEVDIWLVLNSSREEMSMTVPHLDAELEEISRFGLLKVDNQLSEPVEIYAGDLKIESIMYLDGESKDNLSTIGQGSNGEFYIPIPDGEETVSLNLRAQKLSGAPVKNETVTLTVDQSFTWVIDSN